MAAQSTITNAVVNHYSTIARERGMQDEPYAKKVAQSFGYTLEDLAAIPDGANMGLSCGNPLAIAGVKTGEIVIDLGCGGGFDVLQVARKVGPEGLAIGVDISSDMLDRAKRNAEKASIKNVKFVLSPITNIPLESESADCVISNCVINLLPQTDKPICFCEVYRVLKPGGRLAVSDILAKKPFPRELQEHIGLYVGCISGACLVGEYDVWLREAGFKDVVIVDKKADLNVYKELSQDGQSSSCCSTTDSKPDRAVSSCCSATKSQSESGISSSCATAKLNEKEKMKERAVLDAAEEIDFNEWASSFSIYAIKPNTV